MAFDPKQDLESLLKTATFLGDRDQEEHEEKQRRDKEKTEALAMALHGVNYRVPKAGGQRLIPGSRFLCGKERHFKAKCPQAKVQALKPCPLCRGDHWRRDCPQRRGSLGLVPQTQDQN